MYEPFFELKQRPFLAGPVASRYFAATAIEQARQSLMRCVQRAQGTGMIVGPTGTGKSLLCSVLAQQFRASHRTVLLAGAKLCTRKALFQSILFSLGLPYREMSEGELRLALTSRLEPNVDSTAGLLLIVDEADTLPTRLLEELRMLTNVMRDGAPRVHLILAGAPALEERFASPKFESFRQRIAARCPLRALNRDETARYVAWQIATCGGRPEFVFDWSAAGAIFDCTAGIPRLINQVCDYTLHAAATAGERPVMARHLTAAWSELQKTPQPWSTHVSHAGAAPTHVAPSLAEHAAPPVAMTSPGIIEFRSLDELPPLPASSLTEFDFSGSPSLLDQDAVETHATPPAPMPVPDVAPDVAAVHAADGAHVEASHVEAPPVEEASVEEPHVETTPEASSVTVDPLLEATTQTTVVAPPAEYAASDSPGYCMAVAPSGFDWDQEPVIEDAPASVVERLHEERTIESIPFEPEWRESADDRTWTEEASHDAPFGLSSFAEESSGSAAQVRDSHDDDLAQTDAHHEDSVEHDSTDDGAPEGAILRIVRDEEPEAAAEEPELSPPAERRRRFRDLFSRLRRRESA